MIWVQHKLGASAACWFLLIGFGLGWYWQAEAQLTPEQQAQQLLDAANRALNERQYDAAVVRFREFLQRFGGHSQANLARYGWAVALLEGPNRDYKMASELLAPVLGQGDFTFRPWAFYYAGLAQRGLGGQALRDAIGKPADQAANFQREAQARFEQAAKHFESALLEFAKRGSTEDKEAAALMRDWVARSRCDLAEMLLHLRRPKEALAALEPFSRDPTLVKSPYRLPARYYEGQARLLLGDYVGAGRVLSELAPFTHPQFGLHARYLLARAHHELGDRAEAAVHYDQVLAGYEAQRQQAAKMLQNPASFGNDPEQRWRLESLVKQPPEFVPRAALLRAVLFYEEGQFGEAASRLETLLKLSPPPSVQAEAQLRLGMCYVQTRQYEAAVKMLSPLENHATVGELALWWLGRAQAQAAAASTPTNEASAQAAIQSFRRALERNGQRGNDPEARLRRSEILLDLGDALQLIRQYKDAANTYATIVQERVHPQRVEEAWVRQALALHLAGAWKESDDLCRRFRESHPKSPLLPQVLFCAAENSYFLALQLAKDVRTPEREKQLREALQQTVARHRELLEQYPEFPQRAAAWFTVGMCLYRLGEIEKAQQAFAEIAQADRSGPLLLASYYEADCLIRLAPSDTTDALAAGRAQEALTNASKMLAAFVDSAGKTSPYTPEALLKLAYCYRKLAELLVEPKERAALLQQARQAAERVVRDYGNHPLVGAAALERANCLALQGDFGGAAAEWQRFISDPLSRSEVAPLALLRLAQHHLTHHRPADAVKVLELARQRYESTLAQDPQKADWLAQIVYQHALALQDAGKWPEARSVYETVQNRFPQRREAAESAWRIGQVRRAQAVAQLHAAFAALQQASKPEARQAALTGLQAAVHELRHTAAYCTQLASDKKLQQLAADLVPRCYYEAAWCWRQLFPVEREQARQQLVADWQKKQPPPPKGQPPRRPPDFPLTAIPLQPSEQQAREAYKAAIHSATDSPLALDAMFELAELLAEREEHDQAIALLRQVFDREPPADLLEKVHLRLSASLLAKGDAKTALQHAQVVLQNEKSPLAPWARYQAAECLLRLGDKESLQKAAALLTAFRDQGPLQQVPSLSDRALLRLAHAYAQLQQWAASRQACEILLQRYPQSPWRADAQFGLGWALQSENNLEPAVQAYSQVLNFTSAETAARALLQIGRCRMLQKRFADASQAFLGVHLTYDYPELAAEALVEAADAALQLKQPESAQRLLEQVLRDYPQTKAAAVARQRLGK
ncbi:Outer membrane protein assembly factor BamD [bacterium HR36]|nr:Outer membrane protein assembly factor BamD [bacterium HR36]